MHYAAINNIKQSPSQATMAHKAASIYPAYTVRL